ncbi:MAG TPA: hypothetical protein VG649_09560 [Candidatus Angelobacter sp.]|jgi:hypothetical protein|nr:hypothetical protein [Candidatus Angelobacter sp.]
MHTFKLIVLSSTVLAALLFSPPSPHNWAELGPRSSGRVSAIVATDLNHLWAASPGGGVWKSADAGAHWVWAGNYGMGDFTALDLAVDREVPNRMYLRTWNGFWVSTDGAAHWTRTLFATGTASSDVSSYQPGYACGVFPACPPFASVSLNEPRPFIQMLLPAGLGPRVRPSLLLTALPCAGLHYSNNSGNTFTQIWPFPGAHPETNADNCITSIAGDEATGKVYFTTMGEGSGGDHTHIYRSVEPWTASGPPATLHWEMVNNGITQTHVAASIAWGGSANRLMIIITDYSSGPSNAVAYLFNGLSWIPKPFHNPNCIMSDARALVWGGGDDFFAGGVTFGYTTNAGNTWVCPSLGTQYVDIRAIHANRSLGRVWIGGDQSALDSHFVISSYPWTPGSGLGTPTGITGMGIATWQTYTVAVPPVGAHTRRIMVGAQDVSNACTDDDGAHWRMVPSEESQSLIWRQTASGDVLYSYSTKGTLERSTNAGAAASCAAITFSDVSPPDPLRESRGWVGPHAIAVHPRDANKVFTTGVRDIVYTLDGGAHWAKAAFTIAGHSRAPAPSAIFVDENGAIYVGTQDGGAYVCNDSLHFCNGSPGAGAWTAWGLNGGASGASPRMITAIAESNVPPAPRTFWIAASDGLYRKLPIASAWTQVSPTPGYTYSDVSVDSACPTRVYAGLGYLEFISRSRGGIDVSSDNGNHWTSTTSGFELHNVPITQVVVTPGSTRVLSSTFGRGAWEYNASPLPACVP